MSGPVTILVVEDDPVTQAATRKVLDQAGYRTIAVSRGADALAEARAQQPTLILLDRDLPDMDGLEVCKRIKAIPELAQAFVVFASASFAEREEQVKGLEAGGDGYIARPIGGRELLARVEAFVRIAVLNAELREQAGALRETADRLAESNRKLDAQARELEESNKVLRESRRAALNLMEDARSAQQQAEQAGRALALSEARYRNVVDAQQEVICRWLPDTTLTFVNAAYARLRGVDPARLDGARWIDFLTPEDRPQAEAIAREVVEQGACREHEARVETADGRIRFILWHETPVFDEQGRCAEVQSVGRDVTELRHAETEAAKRLNAIEHSPASIVITDREGRIEYVNPAFSDITGYSLEEARGQNPRILKSGHTSDAEYTRLWETISGGETWRGEFLNKRKDGTLYWESASISPVRDARGAITHYVAVKEDITARKESERQLAFFAARSETLLEIPRLADLMQDDEGFVRAALQRAADITGSRRAILCELDAPTGRARCIGSIPEEVEAAHDSVEPTGLFLDALRARRVVVAEHEAGLPFGPGRARRAAVFPIVEGDRVAMLLGVADRAKPYGALELETLQLVGNEIASILSRRRTLRELQLSEALLDEAGQVAGVGGWELNLDTEELRWTRQTRRIHEVPDDYRPTLENGLLFYEPEGRPVLEAAIQEGIRSGASWNLELPFRTAKGRRLWVRAVGQVRRENGRPVKLLGAFQDITEQKRAEEERVELNAQLAQAQKMQSVGLLAGGIAHEFNNKLQVIMGFAEMAAGELAPTSEAAKDLDEVITAAHQSAELTRQLLAYASKQVVQPLVVDLNAVLERDLHMIRKLVGEQIDIVWKPEPALWPVRMDQAQIGQILTNLAINARDAIGEGGTIEVGTANRTLDASSPFLPRDREAGDYTVLWMRDSGHGMDAETLARVFEPFFTTKPVGQGTGLGLATVYGMVRQAGGFVHAESQRGVGSTFTIFLPRDNEAFEQARNNP